DVQAGLDCAMPMERAELKALHGTLTRLVAGLREAME
ncbi:MAG: MarR family transcriptional regulator, partial [Mesorhizobium sp.]